MIYRLIIVIGLLGFIINFWLYSRFTVDDAFITWRYGKNLIDAGIWNYNPSLLDLTQAYTNPIFAFVSIIPHKLNLDVVLFFKSFSILNLVIFSFWFLKQTNKSYISLFLLVSMPATIIHLFSGLETFFYVSLMSILFVALDKNKKILSIFITLILFITRPESWLLTFFIPLFFLFEDNPFLTKINFFKKNLFLNLMSLKTKNFFITGFILFFFLVFYLSLNKAYYGYFLPNTFYAKSSNIFSIDQFVKLTFFILPSFIIIFYNRLKIFLIIFIFSFTIILNYSFSKLSMNYSGRFAFQVFFPIYVFLIYVSTKKNRIEISNINLPYFSSSYITKSIAVLFLSFFYLFSGIIKAELVTYYPRALESHAQLGKTIFKIKDKYNIKSFVFGDAGMTAYHSGLNALDNIGLGSSLTTHNGFTNSLMDKYQIDLIVFHSVYNNIRLDDFNQAIILKWAREKNFVFLCDVYMNSYYILKIYSKGNLAELNQNCELSKIANNNNNPEYLKKTWFKPPWIYWKI